MTMRVRHMRAHTSEGSVLVSILVFFLFLGIVLGVHVRNGTLFSLCVLKKQQHLESFYKGDALLQYGISYAATHYAHIVNTGAPITLRLPVWPPGTNSLMGGQIELEAKGQGVEIRTSLVSANVRSNSMGTTHPVFSCMLTKEISSIGPTMLTISKWATVVQKKEAS